MSADATDLLDAIESELTTIYPGVAIRQSKRQAADGRQFDGGWAEGYPLPCFIISIAEPEVIDDAGTFETYSERYSALIEYVKAAEAKVTGGEGKPAKVVEDPEIRDVRQTLLDNFYKRLQLTRLFDVRVKTRGIWDPSGGGKLLATGVAFTFDFWRTRPGN